MSINDDYELLEQSVNKARELIIQRILELDIEKLSYLGKIIGNLDDYIEFENVIKKMIKLWQE